MVGESRIRLLCLDIDGTLLNSQKELPEENKKAVRYAAEQGVTVAIASGRSLSGMEPIMAELGTGRNAICLNGSLVFGGKEISRTVMGETLVRRVVDMAEKYQSQLFLSAAEFNITNGELSPKLRKLVQNGSLRADYRYCKDYKELREAAHRYGGEILKMAVKEIDEAHFDSLKEELLTSGLFHVAKSDTYFVDVNPREINKGEGVRILAGHLGIPMSQVMCIGDNENDLEMVGTAGVGVAMGNAAGEVKRAAAYVTADNDSGGVPKAIRRFI